MSKFTKSFYTTYMPADKSGINYNSLDSDTQISLNKNYDGCLYLLPCGICERTGKQCPKHYTNSDWYYTSALVNNAATDYKKNTYSTFCEESSITQAEREAFFEEK